MALLYMPMKISLSVLFQLLLRSLRLSTHCIIVFVAGEGPLNRNISLSSVVIHFGKLLGNLGRSLQKLPSFCFIFGA